MINSISAGVTSNPATFTLPAQGPFTDNGADGRDGAAQNVDREGAERSIANLASFQTHLFVG